MSTDFGIYTFVTCYSYADHRRNYHTIGRLFFAPLRIEIHDHNPKYADVHQRMREDYKKLLTQDTVRVSATGQTAAIIKPSNAGNND